MKEDFTVGIIYRITNVISNFFLVNLLWVIFNIPVAYLLLILTTVESFPDILILCLILFALLPFTFYPATTGMYAVVRRWVMREEDVPIWRSFWTYYRSNYVKSMISGLILTILWIVFLADVYYFSVLVNRKLLIIFIPLFIIIFTFTLNLFCSLVHFEEKIFTLMKNAILFTISRFFLTLGTAGLCLVIFYISLKFSFLLISFTGSLVAFVSYKGFNQIYLKIKSVQEGV